MKNMMRAVVVLMVLGLALPTLAMPDLPVAGDTLGGGGKGGKGKGKGKGRVF